MELTPRAWEVARHYTAIQVPKIGLCTVKEWGPREAQPQASLVVVGIPTDITMKDFKDEFTESNASRFGDVSAAELPTSISRCTRLNKRIRDGPASGQWADSTTVRLDMPAPLAEAMLEVVVALFHYRHLRLRVFTATPTKCARCLKTGHKAQFCRNPPACRFCSNGGHESRDCPHAPRVPGGAGTSS